MATELPLGKWKGSIQEEMHNHPLNQIKKLTVKEVKNLVILLLQHHTPVSTICSEVEDKFEIRLKAKDIYNWGQKLRNEQSGRKTLLQ